MLQVNNCYWCCKFVRKNVFFMED